MASEETVVYLMGDKEREAPFQRDFPHLYYRMCRLREAVIGYYMAQNVHTLVSSEFDTKGIPYIGAAEFPVFKAMQYCLQMEKYFKKIPKKNAVLPRPQFSVIVTMEYGEGAFERYLFDFRKVSEEYLIAFCKKIRERGAYYYRLRVTEQYPKVLSYSK